MENQKVNIKLLKAEIKDLYIRRDIDVPEICKMYNINPSTIYQWIKKEGWKSIRDTKMKKFIKSPDILLEMLEKMIEGLTDKLDNPAELAKCADSISKIVKSIKTLSKDKDRLGSIIFVIGELGKHMNEQNDGYIYDDEFRGKFDKLLGSFQKKMLLQYNPKNFS